MWQFRKLYYELWMSRLKSQYHHLVLWLYSDWLTALNHVYQVKWSNTCIIWLTDICKIPKIDKVLNKHLFNLLPFFPFGNTRNNFYWRNLGSPLVKVKFELGSWWRVLRWRPEKDTPRGGTSVRIATAEVQKPMNNTKWICWEGRLEWPGEKGVC